jgi:hypothetical protein
MNWLAVAAVALNAVAEGHYRRYTSFQLPASIAPLISHLAAASASIFVAGAVLGLMLYVNARPRK